LGQPPQIEGGSMTMVLAPIRQQRRPKEERRQDEEE
jgi:hypothetical protein